MATTCSFGQIKDLRARSISIKSRVVIDNDKNIDARDYQTDSIQTSTSSWKGKSGMMCVLGEVSVPNVKANVICSPFVNAKLTCADKISATQNNITFLSDVCVVGNLTTDSITVNGNVYGFDEYNQVNTNTITVFNNVMKGLTDDEIIFQDPLRIPHIDMPEDPRCNTFWGVSTGESNTTGNANTAFGWEALQNNTTASNNIAVGKRALQNFDGSIGSLENFGITANSQIEGIWYGGFTGLHNQLSFVNKDGYVIKKVGLNLDAGYQTIMSFTIDPTGNPYLIYGLSNSSTFSDGTFYEEDGVHLVTIDTRTGNLTVLGYCNNDDIRGIAFDASGTLYAAEGGNGGSGQLGDLLILDKTDGSTISVLGPIGYSIAGIAFHPTTGVLYGSLSRRNGNFHPERQGIVEINPITGAGTFLFETNVGEISTNRGGFADISFTEDGEDLFSVTGSRSDPRSTLVRVDLNSEQVSFGATRNGFGISWAYGGGVTTGKLDIMDKDFSSVTAIGYSAHRYPLFAFNTTSIGAYVNAGYDDQYINYYNIPHNSTIIGYGACRDGSTGVTDSVVIGTLALTGWSHVDNSVLIGNRIGSSYMRGSDNVAVGGGCARSMQGVENIMLGYFCCIGFTGYHMARCIMVGTSTMESGANQFYDTIVISNGNLTRSNDYSQSEIFIGGEITNRTGGGGTSFYRYYNVCIGGWNCQGNNGRNVYSAVCVGKGAYGSRYSMNTVNIGFYASGYVDNTETNGCVSIGTQSYAHDQNVAIGQDAYLGGTHEQSVLIGNHLFGYNSVIIGYDSNFYGSGTQNYNVSVGSYSDNRGTHNVGIGNDQNSSTNAQQNVLIGNQQNTNYNDTLVLGTGGISDKDRDFVIQNITTSISANSGAADPLPPFTEGFLSLKINGSRFKVPLFGE